MKNVFALIAVLVFLSGVGLARAEEWPPSSSKEKEGPPVSMDVLKGVVAAAVGVLKSADQRGIIVTDDLSVTIDADTHECLVANKKKWREHSDILHAALNELSGCSPSGDCGWFGRYDSVDQLYGVTQVIVELVDYLEHQVNACYNPTAKFGVAK